jgi:Leucine-rich repeat (LRR) protein
MILTEVLVPPALQTVPVKPSLFQKLKVLSLRDNRLSDISTEALTSMYQLETLIISHVRTRQGGPRFDE